ncbi:hypothetical protein IQ02_00737 [Flavobacterium glaciei]|uniref:Uncharacterized protein n=2 Tax=Flavobacterium glaciei TaxID=386300 RepID=A0A562PY38_9FLAO|nr:hypothetical protein DFR66_10321 [Flavobacterium glaciei]TWI49345.1 hypothetical protein IQ02_00737 [Flavobacterium glaciei]
MHWRSTRRINFDIRMKKIFFTMIILACNIVFSQTVIPEKYSKIKFVYEQKSNFFIENDKVYADTLLLQFQYPKLKFSKVISPLDSTKIVGFIEIKNFNYEDKKILESTLYHTTNTIEGTYDLKKNKTKLFFKRGNKALTEIFKKYFGGNYNTFLFNIIVDYNSKQIDTNYPRKNYSESFDSQLKKINFINGNNCLGTYTFQTNKGYYTNTVTLNKQYNNKITPGTIFSNTNFGVSEIVSLFDTTTLISVIYE